MPHAIIEYSQNLHADIAAREITRVVHGVMGDSGLFHLADIKTRAYAAADFQVGEMGTDGSFVHITVALLEGRTVAQKQALSIALRDALAAAMDSVGQISIDIRDMMRETYNKHVMV